MHPIEFPQQSVVFAKDQPEKDAPSWVTELQQRALSSLPSKDDPNIISFGPLLDISDKDQPSGGAPVPAPRILGPDRSGPHPVVFGTGTPGQAVQLFAPSGRMWYEHEGGLSFRVRADDKGPPMLVGEGTVDPDGRWSIAMQCGVNFGEAVKVQARHVYRDGRKSGASNPHTIIIGDGSNFFLLEKESHSVGPGFPPGPPPSPAPWHMHSDDHGKLIPETDKHATYPSGRPRGPHDTVYPVADPLPTACITPETKGMPAIHTTHGKAPGITEILNTLRAGSKPETTRNDETPSSAPLPKLAGAETSRQTVGRNHER